MQSMRYFLAAAVALLVCSAGLAGEIDNSDEKPNDMEFYYLHQALHYSVEAYVVRYDNIVKSTWANGAGDKLEISATILEVIKGNKSRGATINFTRTLDGRYGDISGYFDQKYIVFYDEYKSGIRIDPQSPAAVAGYSDKRFAQLITHEAGN